MNRSFALDIRAGADAFGDGSHPSTKGAMTALEALAALHGLRSALDIGCGSGVLTLQIAYQWHIPVLGVDIQPAAVEATLANAEHNGLLPLVRAIRADGYDHPDIQAGAPYDLIACNRLAGPLIADARRLREHLAEEGLAILSGLLRWQAQPVIEAHQRAGLTLLQKRSLGDWTTLLMQAP